MPIEQRKMHDCLLVSLTAELSFGLIGARGFMVEGKDFDGVNSATFGQGKSQEGPLAV